jgi:hypothetical protein
MYIYKKFILILCAALEIYCSYHFMSLVSLDDDVDDEDSDNDDDDEYD